MKWKVDEQSEVLMMTHVKESRLSVIFFAILLTVAVYGLCFVFKNYSYANEKEVCQADKLPSLIELLVPESELNSKSNVSKLIRSLSSPQDKIKVTELRSTDTGDLEFSMFLDISWKEDFNNNRSKAYDNLRLDMAHGIEDLYDKEFNLEKSIITNVERIEKLHDGIIVNILASAMDGQFLEPEEMQKLIEDGSVKLFDEIVRKSLRREAEKLSDRNELHESNYDVEETTEILSENELYPY